MATVARVSAISSASTRVSTRGPVRTPIGLSSTRSAPARSVVVRFLGGDKKELDRAGAQHTGFKQGHEELKDDKLSTTVAGTYEWQIFYIFLAGTILFFPLIPGVTQLATKLYEGVGGHLNV